MGTRYMYKTIFTVSVLTLALAACGGNGSNKQDEETQLNNQQGSLSISGEAKYGATLNAIVSDPDGLSNSENIKYQWKRDSINIAGANSKSYQIQKEDINTLVSVSVNYVDDKGFNASLNTVQTTKVLLVNLPGLVTLQGSAKQGQMLEANLSDDNNGLDESSVSLVWYADSKIIPNKDSKIIKLERDQVGKKVSVEVSYVDGHGYYETLVSDETAAVEKIDNSQGVLSVTDDAGNNPSWKVGTSLQANISDLNQVLAEVDYYWYRNDDLIFENNQSTYTILAADIDKKISVKAEYVDADGYSESVFYQSSQNVSSDPSEPNPQNYPVGDKLIGNNPIDRVEAISEESFEHGGWNAGTINGNYNPGHDASIPKQFRFTQFQNPDSFKAETNVTRLGDYSAKLYWQHGDPGKWNDDPNKIDNVDRKAMLHGRNAKTITSTFWHGFSVYFPSDEIQLKDGENPLFFQLHGAPDSGEPGRQPPLALTMQTDGFYVGYGWDSRKFNTSTSGEGRDKFQIPVNLAEYQDRWVDFVIQVRANPFEEKGFIKIWIDGKQMADRTNIQIGYNDDKGLYPSWGWYFTGTINVNRDTDGTMYLDEIRHVEADDASYYDVAPGYFSLIKE